MGLFFADIKTMEDLFTHTLQDIYYAENRIAKALPDMIEKATDGALKRAFKSHLAETKTQIKRLDGVFGVLEQRPKGTKCPAIDGIIAEANDIAGECEDEQVLNAALIGAAQAVEHYEMTRYGTLIEWAKTLGHRGVIRPLQQNLAEEKGADKKLTAIARAVVNVRAAGREPARSEASRPRSGTAAARSQRRTSRGHARPKKTATRKNGRGRRAA